ncbi:hypothetical protein D0867_13413 [Hortaea werneckii]|uniref:CWH43-like N-terminal domain-containing protein n=1 Tax=Hortaea werneckii TaxID=91943 RepID=A0A3M6XY48_HORWE|nr:putative FK506 suppressor Sfk1 [Hortaea werneckii]KAI6956645.1 putative FK506 suppressor Sfk1 [Hortaea werneckii]RMX95662.1 hypothetical protein D0867_13413 [Hortaea werneckii]RMY16569.1 hypothetical protein D0866_13654 [Hortaea werneckii]
MYGISYWFLPAFSGCVWLGTLLGMLGGWVANGEPQYPWMDGQTIAFISHVGATYWGKPLFIAGSATAQVAFVLCFISERWLRHRGRLTHNYTTAEKALSVCASIFAIIGACGLILLTIFDTRRYPPVHEAMLAVFIAGYIISAIFICAEYQRLGIFFREYRILRASFWIKLTFIIVEIALAIAFGVTQYRTADNSKAIIEWIIALMYIFYTWSFIIDFLPATRTKHKDHRFPPVRAADDEMAMNTQHQGSMTNGPVYSSGGHYGDTESHGSQQPMQQGERAGPSQNF